MAVAAPRKTGTRNSLGEEIDGLLADFSAANCGAPATSIIREAVKFFVEERLKNEPAMEKRFKEARRIRLGQVPLIAGDNVVAIKPNS